MPNGKTDGSVQRKLEGVCLECGVSFLRPWVAHMRKENELGDSAGYDVMAYCSEICEVIKLAVLFKRAKVDPGQMFHFVGGLNVEKRKREQKKQYKSATA
jgi:hypothetical protein